MKKIFTLLKAVICIFLLINRIYPQTVIVTDDQGYTTGEVSAVLDVKSVNKGILVPRMTLSERNIIGSPATGLLIYQTDDDPGFYYYNGTSWGKIGSDNLGSHTATQNLNMANHSILNVYDFQVKQKFKDANNEEGTAGQVLSSTFWGTDWIDPVSEINDLDDGKTDGSSLFLGGGGNFDNGMNNNNTAVGYNALFSNVSGHSNTALGAGALLLNTEGSNNVAIGGGVLASNTSGYTNIGLGSGALHDNISGYGNVAIGVNSQFSNISGHGNTSIGYLSLQANTTGNNNLALGYNAMNDNRTGVGNIAIGVNALEQNINGGSNLAIGYGAGLSAAGSNNIFIGNAAGSNETGNNKLYIDNTGTSNPLIWGDFDTDNMMINGHLMITNTLKDKDGQAGISGQVLSSTASGIDWIDSPIGGATEIDELADGKTGGNSVFLGLNAGLNDDGSNNQNTAFGVNAMLSNITGNDNVAVGYNVLKMNTEGGMNTAFGSEVLSIGSNSYGNAAFGHFAMHYTNSDDNAAFGGYAMYSNTSGYKNTAVGRSAMYYNQDGMDNTAVGAWALNSNTSGDFNTAVGESSLSYITTGSGNTSLGWKAGYFNTGDNNIFIGNQAGYNETGSNKLYIENSNSSSPLIYGDFSADLVRVNGDFHVMNKLFDSSQDHGLSGQFLSATGTGTNWIVPAIDHLSDGRTLGFSTFLGENSGVADDGSNNQNSALGYYSMNLTNTGTGNAALGYQALRNNTSGNYNTALGQSTLQSNGTGGQNTAVGSGSLYNNTSGVSNTGIGVDAMVSNISGGSNSALGENALNANTSGSFNVALGAKAGYSTTGDLNVFVGNEAGYNETASNKLYIDNSNTSTPLIWGDFNLDDVKINGSLFVRDHLLDSGNAAPGNGEILFGTGSNTDWRIPVINDLTDGITDESSTYLGLGSGVQDDLSGNKNTGVGYHSLHTNSSGDNNTAVGNQALEANSTGGNNAAFGHQALLSSNGSFNTANGAYALNINSTGSYNTAIGFGALAYNQANTGSVAVGYNAMYNANNTSSGAYTYNTAVGFEALKGSTVPANNTGLSNTSVGYQTLFNNSSGGFNTSVGTGALYSNTLGNNNTALGTGALYSNKANSGSVAIGHNAMFYANDNTSGLITYNTAIGVEALKGSSTPANNTGHSNTTIGYQSMFSNTSGDQNTAIGRYSLFSNTSGDNNTSLGYQAGYLSNGNGNVFLGYTAGYFESGNNKLYIDNSNGSNPLIWGDFSDNQVKINGDFQTSGAIKDSYGSTGTSGQVLSTTVTGTDWINFPPGDNLGNHYATQDIVMASAEIALNGGWISGDGDDEGLTVNNQGMVGVGIANPGQLFQVYGISAGGAGHFTNNITTADYYGVYGQCSNTDYYGYGGYFVGGYRGVLGIVNATGSNSYQGVYGTVSGGSGTKYGLYGTASGSGSNYGVFATASGGSTNYAGYFDGNVHVNGTLSKSGGSFKIDHPLDPENKYLSHSFVESEDMMNIYNGNVVTDANGMAIIELPLWFQALNKDFRYQLTVIGTFAQAIVYQKIENNQFSIKTDIPEVEVSWQVTGIRNDPYANANRIQVVQDKNDKQKGRYLNPDVYGKGPEWGISHEVEKHSKSEVMDTK